MDIDVTINHDPYSYETLIRSIYTSPDTACIREIVRNALDAHIDAGIPNTEVDVSFSDYFFYVRDYGKGITPDKLKSLMSVLMKSDKRDKHTGNDDTQTGQHGLGSKTPFGILYEAKKKGNSCVVFMTSIVGDTKWVYELIIKDDGMPTYSLLKEEKTSDSSGVEYMIQLTKSMRNISHYKFLEIFAPIHDKINFIGYDFSKHLSTVDLGKYKIHFFKKFKDETVEVNTSLHDISASKQQLNDLSDRLMVKYEGLLYPSPVNCGVKSIEECADRIKQDYESSEFVLADRYIIEYDIGNESYGMETTRSRDGFIIEDSNVEQLRDDMQHNIPKVSHEDFIKCVVISGLNMYREHIKNKNISSKELEFDNNMLHSSVKFNVTSTVLRTLISYDRDFYEYVHKHGIKNQLVFEKYCIDRRLFTVEELLRCLKANEGFHDNDKISDLFFNNIYDTYSLFFSEYYNIHPSYNPDKFQYTFSSVTSEKAVFSSAYSLRNFVKSNKNMNSSSNKLVVSDVYEIKNDKLISSAVMLSNESDIHNDFTVLYKDSKINKRKLEAYVRQQNKPVVVMESSKTTMDDGVTTTTLVQKHKFDRYLSADMDLLLCHHMENPVVFSSEVMPKIKAIKKERETHSNPFKVKDLDTKSRGINIINEGRIIDDCTYQSVMDLYENYDTVYVMDESIITKIKSYYDAYDVHYSFDGTSNFGFMRVVVNSKDNRLDSHVIKSFNASIIASDKNIIVFNGKPSKVLHEFVNSNPKTVNANELFDTFIEEIEENDFKTFKGMGIFDVNEPLSIDEIINQVTLLIAIKSFNSRFSEHGIRTISYNGNIRHSMLPLKYLIDKHIFDDDERMVDIERLNMVAFNSILYTYSGNDVKCLLKKIEEIDNKLVDIIESYSKIDLDFVKMTIEASDKSHVSNYSLVKQYEQAFKF